MTNDIKLVYHCVDRMAIYQAAMCTILQRFGRMLTTRLMNELSIVQTPPESL